MATQAEVAAHLFLDQAVVSRLLAKGVLPAAGRGQLDMDSCRQAYIEHVRASAAGRDSSKPGSLEAERARLAAAQAETQERKNAKERGELVPLTDIDANVREFISRLMNFIDHVPARIAGSDHKLRRRIEQGLNEAREELSSTEVVDSLIGVSAATLQDEEDED